MNTTPQAFETTRPEEGVSSGIPAGRLTLLHLVGSKGFAVGGGTDPDRL